MKTLFSVFLCRSGNFNLFLFLVNIYDFVWVEMISFQRLDKFYHYNFLGIRILNVIFSWGLFQLQAELYHVYCDRAVIFKHTQLFGSFHFPRACTLHSFILYINFLNFCFSNLFIILLGIFNKLSLG